MRTETSTRTTLVLIVLSSLSSLWAQAPESLSGKVYRDSYLQFEGRSAGERTIIFGPGGKFLFLKWAWMQGPNVAPGGGKVPLIPTDGDGSYAYRKTGSGSGHLDLAFDDGTTATMELRFSTAENGTFTDPRVLELVFQLKELAITAAAPARNVSMRGRVAGNQPLIAGFVVPGSSGPRVGDRLHDPGATDRDVLIRVVGPSLISFGVTSAWSDPQFEVFSGPSQVRVNQAMYQDWSVVPERTTPAVSPDRTEEAFKKLFDYVGAFPLLSASKDAAAVLRLAPGAYTIVASPSFGDPGGEVLIEVYFLP